MSGVGSAEPPESGAGGSAAGGSGEGGVGSTEPPESGAGGFAAGGSGEGGVGSTEPPESGAAGFAAGGSGKRAHDAVWAAGRVWIGWPTRALTRARFYGVERVPAEGGIVIASNHFSWVDPPLVGAACPRRIEFVAKIEAHRVPGLGQLIRAHGTLPIRRGESDREAVRKMREAVRAGGALGLFVEGTRQRSGTLGKVQPGAAMVALQEGVPVVPVALHGTQHWKLGNFAPCSLVFGEPMRFDGLPRGGRGYKEASAEIGRELQRLWEWLVDVHARGRPRWVELP